MDAVNGSVMGQVEDADSVEEFWRAEGRRVVRFGGSVREKGKEAAVSASKDD